MPSTELEYYVLNRNIEGFNRLKAIVNNPNGPIPTQANVQTIHNNPPPSSNHSQYKLKNEPVRAGGPMTTTMPSQPYRAGIAMLIYLLIILFGSLTILSTIELQRQSFSYNIRGFDASHGM